MKTPTRRILEAFIVTLLTAPPWVIGASEVLYNGIDLPAQWPPQRTAADLTSGKPMPVPYLKQPPSVIPIDVGRQTFVDDFLIDSSSLLRRFHQPEYHQRSPVMQPEREWEKETDSASAGAYSDGVWYDPAQQTFMMWYRAAKRRTCLALSADGISWNRPALDLEGGTNVVLQTVRDSTTVWLDHESADPAARFKLFATRSKQSLWQIALRLSPDGRQWSDEVATSGPSWDRSTVFWNPFRKVWVASVRGHDSMKPAPVHRVRCYHEGKTPEAALGWKQHSDEVAHGNVLPGDLQPWVAADCLDPRHRDPRFRHLEPQLYNLDAFPYESLMVGLFTIWSGPDNETCRTLGIHKRNEVLVGFSRDGFHWDRTSRAPFLAVSDDPRAWNAGNVQSVGGGCLVVGDRLYFYCSGRTMHPTNTVSTGLAMLRRDGFASMDAGDTEGVLITRPVRFAGKYLFVNADCPAGELRVSVLPQGVSEFHAKTDPASAPFAAERCVPIRANSTIHRVHWHGTADLTALSSKPVRFCFRLTNGALYSFWVSSDESGASHGYVAAGGPGFPASQDTAGLKAYETGTR
jgi:hypothetical protein